jgi:hypothetical protein
VAAYLAWSRRGGERQQRQAVGAAGDRQAEARIGPDQRVEIATETLDEVGLDLNRRRTGFGHRQA